MNEEPVWVSVWKTQKWIALSLSALCFVYFLTRARPEWDFMIVSSGSIFYLFFLVADIRIDLWRKSQ